MVTGNDDLASSEHDSEWPSDISSTHTFNDDKESKDTSEYIDVDSSYRYAYFIIMVVHFSMVQSCNRLLDIFHVCKWSARSN